MQFSHIGVPTTESKVGEVYSPEMKLFYTDFTASKHNVEWLRFDADCEMPKEILEQPHVAFVVDSLESAIGDQKVILPPCVVNEELKIAFVVDAEGCPVEYMEFTK